MTTIKGLDILRNADSIPQNTEMLQPSEFVWENIEQHLFKKKRKFAGFFKKAIAGLLGICLLLFSTSQIWNNKKNIIQSNTLNAESINLHSKDNATINANGKLVSYDSTNQGEHSSQELLVGGKDINYRPPLIQKGQSGQNELIESEALASQQKIDAYPKLSSEDKYKGLPLESNYSNSLAKEFSRNVTNGINNNLSLDDISALDKSISVEKDLIQYEVKPKVQNTNELDQRKDDIYINTPFLSTLQISNLVSKNSNLGIETRINSIMIAPVKRISKSATMIFANYKHLAAINSLQKIDNPSNEVIQSTQYDNTLYLETGLQKQISKKWSIYGLMNVRQDRIVTDFDLNIKYDFMSEVHLSTHNENHFQHSLPTGLGNISTSMVVTRGTDSPVVHNENINVDLVTDLVRSHLGIQLGGRYSIIDKLQLGAFIGSELNVSSSVSEKRYHSNHTYVMGKTLDLSTVTVSQRAQFTYGLDLQYGIVLFNDINLNLTSGINSTKVGLGRITFANIGLGIQKSF